MGQTSRKKYSAAFKSQVALAALREDMTLSELSKKYDVAPTMISRWKAELVKNAASAFETLLLDEEAVQKKIDRLNAKIGQLTMELDFAERASRKLGIPMSAKK